MRASLLKVIASVVMVTMPAVVVGQTFTPSVHVTATPRRVTLVPGATVTITATLNFNAQNLRLFQLQNGNLSDLGAFPAPTFPNDFPRFQITVPVSAPAGLVLYRAIVPACRPTATITCDFGGVPIEGDVKVLLQAVKTPPPPPTPTPAPPTPPGATTTAQPQPPPAIAPASSGSGVGSAVGSVMTGIAAGAVGAIVGPVVGNMIAHKGKLSQNKEAVPKPAGELVAAKGLTLRHPKDWRLNKNVLNIGGPIALMTFDKYDQGGVIPPGGAQIDITTTLLDGDAAGELERDLGPSQTLPATVGKLPALRTNYDDDFAPTLQYKNTAVYVAKRHVLYKFFLSYRKDDPNSAKYMDEFDSIMDSVVFTN
jgi:hypothetical protein